MNDIFFFCSLFFEPLFIPSPPSWLLVTPQLHFSVSCVFYAVTIFDGVFLQSKVYPEVVVFFYWCCCCSCCCCSCICLFICFHSCSLVVVYHGTWWNLIKKYHICVSIFRSLVQAHFTHYSYLSLFDFDFFQRNGPKTVYCVRGEIRECTLFSELERQV